MFPSSSPYWTINEWVHWQADSYSSCVIFNDKVMKSNWKYAVFSVKKSKTFKSMRFFLIFCFFCIPGVMANGYSQEQVVSLNLKQCDVIHCVRKYGNKRGYVLFTMKSMLRHFKRLMCKQITKQYRKCWMKYLKIPHCVISLRTILFISWTKQKDEPEKKEGRSISGTVKDTKKNPLPGVTVLIKGTTVGVVTDVDGKF